MKRAHTTIAFLAAVAAGTMIAPAALPAESLEYPVKANYLVRFAAFTDWPAEAFPTPASPITICVAGQNPFGSELEKAAAGQVAHGRPIEVRRPQPGVRAACHIVYVGRTTNPALEIDRLRTGPVLIVTDEANAPSRGAIHFVIVSQRVRFRVDQTALPQGVTIDSRLLSLAVSVRSRP